MPKRTLLLAALTLVGITVVPTPTVLAERNASRTFNARPEIALQYDFFVVDGVRIGDAAKPKHDGTLQNGEIVVGKRKPAVRLDGNGSILVASSAEALNPAQKAFSVGALCRPTAPNGVVVAMGGARNGFSLYLKDGVPQFAVRSNGELTTVAGDDQVALDQWVHLFAAVGGDGEVQLVVNAWPVAKGQGKLIARAPEKPMSIGMDSGGPIGDYKGPMGWHGLLEDVRLYWGVVDRDEHRDELGDWADRPGCGCRK